MDSRLEALRILVAAGIIPAQGQPWTENLLNQAANTIIQLAVQLEREAKQAQAANMPAPPDDEDIEPSYS